MSKNSKRLHPVKRLTKQDFTNKVKQGHALLSSNPKKALSIFRGLISQDQKTPVLWVLAGRAYQRLGLLAEAEKHVNRAITLQHNYSEALYAMADILYLKENYDGAEKFIENKIKGLSLRDGLPLRAVLASVYQKQKKFLEAIDIYESLIRDDSSNWLYWNNLGMIYQDLTDFDLMDKAYEESCNLTQSTTLPYFNQIVSAHYNPNKTAVDIMDLCYRWQKVFKCNDVNTDFAENKRVPNKTLRIGMISDGFRVHPVGNMITEALSHIPSAHIQLYAYSTNYDNDHLTLRIQSIVRKWTVIEGLSDNVVENMIREDEIDILFDLCGYNVNSRMLVFLNKPAPIQVKWVGGLISSTGLVEIDYLLSDYIESPLGHDHFYTEKLIRMPGDYICYNMPSYLPELTAPPVTVTGFITFGCFNNAVKINDVLLEQWAKILNLIPHSRLYLKSFNYRNEDVRQRIIVKLANLGVISERITLEGDSPHEDLLSCYNKVDIALDPWPYSGGLTTCEAMAMGVPVITLPGPTFAGRHSASHVTNAGMPELIANSWDEYCNLALNLAEDIDSLKVIRKHLREHLIRSPVCDAPRYALHFTNAMRAIWQRFCDHDKPAALNLYHDENPIFIGDSAHVKLDHPTDNLVNENFTFNFYGKINLLDYGAVLASQKHFKKLIATGAINTILIDPAGVEENSGFEDIPGIRYLKFHFIGDGKDTKLNMCLDNQYSSDLEPLENNEAHNELKFNGVFEKITLPSLCLEKINGLDSLDWIVLNNIYDLKKVLNFNKKVISQCLCISIKYTRKLSHREQMSYDEIKSHISLLDFKFLSLKDGANGYSPELERGSDGVEYFILIPNDIVINSMPSNQLEKLAFILHFQYGLTDEVFKVLGKDDCNRAQRYLNLQS